MHSTKFSVGQRVWLLHDNKAMCGKVSHVSLTIAESNGVEPDVVENYEVKYIKPKPEELYIIHATRSDVDVQLLYASREELINDL